MEKYTVVKKVDISNFATQLTGYLNNQWGISAQNNKISETEWRIDVDGKKSHTYTVKIFTDNIINPPMCISVDVCEKTSSTLKTSVGILAVTALGFALGSPNLGKSSLRASKKTVTETQKFLNRLRNDVYLFTENYLKNYMR